MFAGGDIAKANDPLKLHGIFSPSLDLNRSWYALKSTLCGCNPSRFGTLAYAGVFPSENRQIKLDDLCLNSVVPTSATWFSDSGQRNEKVYVASAFGLSVGILCQKSLVDI